jgi:hypothetical protein
MLTVVHASNVQSSLSVGVIGRNAWPWVTMQEIHGGMRNKEGGNSELEYMDREHRGQ